MVWLQKPVLEVRTRGQCGEHPDTLSSSSVLGSTVVKEKGRQYSWTPIRKHNDPAMTRLVPICVRPVKAGINQWVRVPPG